MMKTSKHEDMEALERQVNPWLMKKGIPYQRYDNLSAYLKVVLRNLVCIPTRLTTYTERVDLWKKLCLPDILRGGIDLDDFVPPDEQLQEFFSPLTPSETLPHWKMFYLELKE